MQRRFAGFFLAACLASSAAAADQAPFAEVDKAAFYLKEFEKEVARARGAASANYYNKQEALSRVKRLNDAYPDDPRVRELMKRASAAVEASMGGFRQITADMTAYKRNEAEMRQRLAELNGRRWQEIVGQKKPLENAFPAPVPEETDPGAYMDRYVLLENVRYPANEFVGGTGEYIYAGRPSSGYYFISMQGRGWAGAYEAVRRYRSLVDASLGENLELKVMGKITGLVMEAPDAAAEKRAPFAWGWIVVPEMIFAGERVLGVYDPSRENSGYFVGEEQVEKIKDSWYTVRSVPENVDPKRLMEIFATAIKEKNFELYRNCIHPDRGRTETGSSLLRYHWDLHQARFEEEYVHVEFDEPKITVIRGYDNKNDLDSYFLSGSQKEKLERMGGEKEEMAIVVSRAYDENGRQVGSENRHELRRRGNGRWYVNTYDVRF